MPLRHAEEGNVGFGSRVHQADQTRGESTLSWAESSKEGKTRRKAEREHFWKGNPEVEADTTSVKETSNLTSGKRSSWRVNTQNEKSTRQYDRRTGAGSRTGPEPFGKGLGAAALVRGVEGVAGMHEGGGGGSTSKKKKGGYLKLCLSVAINGLK